MLYNTIKFQVLLKYGMKSNFFEPLFKMKVVYCTSTEKIYFKKSPFIAGGVCQNLMIVKTSKQGKAG